MASQVDTYCNSDNQWIYAVSYSTSFARSQAKFVKGADRLAQAVDCDLRADIE